MIIIVMVIIVIITIIIIIARSTAWRAAHAPPNTNLSLGGLLTLLH